MNVHVHSIRKRLTDSDGVSVKALLDGLVHEKILKDDSPEYIKNISYSQEVGDPERTILRITNVE